MKGRKNRFAYGVAKKTARLQLTKDETEAVRATIQP